MRPTTLIAALTSMIAFAAPLAAQDAQPEKTNPEQAPKATPMIRTQQVATDVPRPKIFGRDADGKVIQVTQLPDILALKANPTVGPKSVELIMPVHYGRRARFELLLMNNLDLYWMVTDGRLNNVNLGNMKQLSQLAEMIKPLVGKTSFTDELQNRGILTRTQAATNRHIVNEYKQAVQSEIQFESDNPLADLMRFILKDSLMEANLAYQELVAETMINADEAVEAAGLESSEAQALAAMAAELSDDPNERVAQYMAFDQAFRTLSVDEGIALLEGTRSLREHENLSPMIQEIDVLHSGKVIISDSKSLTGTVITTPDGSKIHAKDTQAEYAEVHERKKKEFMEEAKNVGKSKKDDDGED